MKRHMLSILAITLFCIHAGSGQVLKECLVLPMEGDMSRAVVYTDPVQALLVSGAWAAPKAGDTVTFPDASTRQWEAVTANAEGWFEHPALRNGYAFISVPSEREKVVLLESAGSVAVIVNGEPRVGDVYGHGYVAIDGSVQYYAVLPAQKVLKDAPPPARVLTLHGAGVEAIGQVDAYSPKTWATLVAPTNRRPVGFNWEDWGRLDALEVLELARKQWRTDPYRVYLTGHSMGGHSTWQVGLTHPDRFAVIAPSAGWVSIWTYATSARLGQRERAADEKTDPMEQFLLRCASPSDTLGLVRNSLL